VGTRCCTERGRMIGGWNDEVDDGWGCTLHGTAIWHRALRTG
jgi:hypothetical protein